MVTYWCGPPLVGLHCHRYIFLTELYHGKDDKPNTRILVGVFTVRTLMFPLVIKAQRNAAKMTNNMPQLQVLQQKMTDARQAGNAMEGILLSTQVTSFFFSI